MRVSQLTLDTTPNGQQSVIIYDPNEPLLADRVKRVLLSSITGQVGNDGEDGKSAYQLWLDEGNSGTVQDFFLSLRGPGGFSAYQIWLDQGNVGNESEFLDSLVGPTGPSLYQVWLDAGNVGTEQDFLDTITGIPGQDGTLIYTGTTDPDNGTGVENDLYINTTTGSLFKKVGGSWGTSLLTIKGGNGTIWRTGTGVPSNGIGQINDYYLDVQNGNVYGPKTSVWGSIVGNIRGPQGNQGNTGAQGATILSGNTAPSNGLGRNGDYYLNLSNGNFYGPKAAGAWGSQPSMFLLTYGTDYSIRDESEALIFNRTFGEGLSFVQGGDTTITLDDNTRQIIISSTTTWSSLQNKPTTRDGFGIQDVYTIAGTDQAILDNLVFDNIANKPTTLAGYGITDAYTKTETDTAIDVAIQSLGNPLNYVGTWDASTNTPTLSDNDIGVGGYLYQVAVAGSVDFGNGSISFDVGDKVVNNGTVWQKWDMTDGVISVNGQGGLVVLNTDDVQQGITNLYLTTQNLTDVITPILGESDSIVLSYYSAFGFIVADLKLASVSNQYLETPSFDLNGVTIELGSSFGLDDLFGYTTNGLLKRTGVNTYEIAITGTDYCEPTNGTSGQVLTSDGTGGFGTPLDPGIDLATLVGGKVPSAQLPSYVDDVVEVELYADLPVTGESGKIYVVTDGNGTEPDNTSYRWTGTVYIKIVASPGTTDNVTEGTINLYFTDERVVSAAQAALDEIFNLSTTGLIKRTGINTYEVATAGTDYATATNGLNGNILTSNGAGGFGTPLVLGTDVASLTGGKVPYNQLPDVVENISEVEGIVVGDGAGNLVGAKIFIPYSCTGEDEVITTGQKIKFRWQGDFKLFKIKGSLNTAQATGTEVTVDVKVNGVSVFSTLLTFDNTEETTKTATTPAVLTTTDLLDDDVVTIEVTQVGDGTAEGLKIYFIGHPVS